MAKKNNRDTSPTVSVDDNILRDMVDIDALQALLESFGQICGTGAGIFTPAGIRLGEPAHHHDFCTLLYGSAKGKKRCQKCDKKHIEQIKHAEPLGPYDCANGLVDFCEPIYCRVGGEQRLIGVFFAGQVLYEEGEITSDSIHKLQEVAVACGVNPDELLARYMEVPRVPYKRVNEIRAWMKEFTKFIGLLVEKKAATQQLLLDVIDSADDQRAIVRTICEHLRPASVSIFMKRHDVPEGFRDRVFLVATTSEKLASRVPLEEDLDKISYKPDEGFTGWIYKTGEILHIKDVRNASTYPQDPYPPEWKHKVREIPDVAETEAFLGAPIRSDEKEVVGVIRAVRLKGDRAFRDDEIALLTGIAPLVGVAAAKAQFHRERSEKMEALAQAEGLLMNLTEPNATLDSITTNMVEQLGQTYVTKRGGWEGVYVLQHLRSSKQFRIVAAFPRSLPKEFRGEPFPDTEGVAGHILHKTRRTFASANCARDKVRPTTPWTSVVCAPIFHKDRMWGAVSLCCERELSQTDVDLATPKITQFAEHMSLVCTLSEILDMRNTATLVASNVLSLSLEAHEVYKSLESAKKTVEHLCRRVGGQNGEIVRDLAKEVDESLRWADVCLELGRYIELCQIKPDSAISLFRKRHMPPRGKGRDRDMPEHVWEQVDIGEVCKKTFSSAISLAQVYEARLTRRIWDPGFVLGDENLLSRAIRNLLENAIVNATRIAGKVPKYKKGVRVSLSVAPLDDGHKTRFVIRDDGVGMDSDVLAATKEIYADSTLLGRTSFSPGFGTMIIAFAVSIHLGSISIKSKPGYGTRVCIELPSYRRKGS